MFAYQDSDTYQGPTVAGITSYGDSNCAVYGVSTKVSAFTAFIDRFVSGSINCDADGSCNPECEEDPDCDVCTDLLPAGAPCVNDADCCSGKCKGRPGSEVCK